MIYQRKVFRSFGRVKRDKRPRHCACSFPLRMKQELEVGICLACMIDKLCPPYLRINVEFVPTEGETNGDN